MGGGGRAPCAASGREKRLQAPRSSLPAATGSRVTNESRLLPLCSACSRAAPQPLPHATHLPPSAFGAALGIPLGLGGRIDAPHLHHRPTPPSSPPFSPHTSIIAPRLHHCPTSPSSPHSSIIASIIAPRLHHCPTPPSWPHTSIMAPHLHHRPTPPSWPHTYIVAPHLHHHPAPPPRAAPSPMSQGGCTPRTGS